MYMQWCLVDTSMLPSNVIAPPSQKGVINPMGEPSITIKPSLVIVYLDAFCFVLCCVVRFQEAGRVKIRHSSRQVWKQSWIFPPHRDACQIVPVWHQMDRQLGSRNARRQKVGALGWMCIELFACSKSVFDTIEIILIFMAITHVSRCLYIPHYLPINLHHHMCYQKISDNEVSCRCQYFLLVTLYIFWGSSSCL